MATSAAALQGPETWVPLVLTTRTQISPDTFLFRFALPTPENQLGLPVGQNIQVRSTAKGENGEDIIRAYTPVSSNDDLGFMDLLIKVIIMSTKNMTATATAITTYLSVIAGLLQKCQPILSQRWRHVPVHSRSQGWGHFGRTWPHGTTG